MGTHWPLEPGGQEHERERLLHTLGNLTLLTAPLNSKISNGPWFGPNGKWAALEAHDVLLLNNGLRKAAPEAWTHGHIKSRTDEMIEAVLSIWPAPIGHRVSHARERLAPLRAFDLADLINAGELVPGA
jgi:hypothetical protein